MFTDARLTNFMANTLALLAVCAIVAGVVFWIVKRPYFTITEIRIEPAQAEALNYVSAATVQATIAGRLMGNFFTIDLDKTRELLESAPWVRHASVRRVWPNTLRVQLEEQ